MKLRTTKFINYRRQSMVSEKALEYVMTVSTNLLKNWILWEVTKIIACSLIVWIHIQYIFLFVDDLLICSTDKNKILEIKVSLMKRFAMEELGKIENYIGLNIDYDYERISKTKNIESLAVKYNLENTKLLDTPMETN